MVHPPVHALLLILGLALIGCPPADSGASNNRRTHRSRHSQPDVRLPAPSEAAISAAREGAVTETSEQRAVFDRMATAAWEGGFELARATLGELLATTEDKTPMARVLKEWRTFIDAEEAATAALTEARRITDDLTDLRTRITRIQQLFVDSRLRDISRVCNDPDRLPALEAWLDRERPARVLWMQYENGRTGMAKALALSRLLRDQQDSELVSKAGEALDVLIETGIREVRELAENRRFRRADDNLRRWRSILEGLDDYLADINAVADEVAALAEQAGDTGPSSTTQPTEVLIARERLRDLVAHRLATIDDYPEMRSYVGKVLERAKGSRVLLSAMPMVRQYRAVCEQLFAAERFAELDRLIALRIEEVRSRSDTREELSTMRAMRDDYRQRVLDAVKQGDIEITTGDWLYWEILQGYFGGRESKEMREFRLPRGIATLVWPDDQLRDFSFEVEFEVIRATSLRVFAKCDRNGRGGLTVSLQPRRDGAQVSSFAEADSIQVNATLYTGSGQTATATATVGLRGNRIKVELKAKGGQAIIEVGGKSVLNERLRDNVYFPEQRGIAGFAVAGEDSRVIIRDVRLRDYEEDGPPAVDNFASREPTAAEQALESQIRTARDALVAVLEEAHRKATEAGYTSTADFFERELAAFRSANIHTTVQNAPAWLAAHLLDTGCYLDAKTLVEVGAVTDEALLARLTAAMKPILPSAMVGWLKLADDAVSRDKMELDGDEVTLTTSGVLLAQQPQFLDFTISGRLRVSDGVALNFLLRQTASSMRASAFVSIRLRVYRDASSRRGDGQFRDVEFNRQSGGAIRIPLPEPVSTRGTIDFRIDVIGQRVTLWFDRDKVAELRRMPGMTRPSPIGFRTEPREGKTDVRLTDMQIIPLRVPVEDDK